MTIQDALERAKQLRRTREVVQPTTRLDRSPRRPDDDATSRTVQQERPHVEPVPVDYPELERVDFDHEECTKRKVLVTEQQLSEMGPAAAAIRQLRSRVLHRMRGRQLVMHRHYEFRPGRRQDADRGQPGDQHCARKAARRLPAGSGHAQSQCVRVIGRAAAGPVVTVFHGGLAPEQVLFATEFERLMLAGNRDAVQNASELLASPKLDELLAYIRRRSPGAAIVIDLPPTISTDEALVVAPRTDALFLVVCEGKTRRDGLTRAINVLGDFSMAGIIMNRSSENLAEDYYAY